MNSGLEIERKYLIRMPDLQALRAMPGCVEWDIVQTYLHDGEEGQTRRVRKITENGNVSYVFTYKRHISDIAQEERERELSRAEYDELFRDANTALSSIHKHRFRIPYRGHTVEVDVYSFWADRATLEIEQTTEADVIEAPEWLDVIREVTGEAAYKNRQLAARVPLEEIGSN